MKLTLTYTLIAIVATAINLASQELTVRACNCSYQLVLSVIVGTATGLVSKYVLDKAFIFNFHARNAVHDAQVFVLYTAAGVVTTAIFWAFEFAFNAVFQDKDMRYAGALIGLALGYFIKYRLDKRFVFRSAGA